MESSRTIEKLIGYVQRAQTQEAIVKYLRTLGFAFYSTQALWMCNSIKAPEEYGEYAWFIRQISAEEGHTDRRLVFGIKLNGRKKPYVIILKNKKFFAKMKIPWKVSKKTNFKKVKIKMKFTGMTYKERRTWRHEHEKLKKDSKLKPSQFYLENVKYVEYL